MKTTNGWRTLRCRSPHAFKLLIDWNQHCWKTQCIKAIHVEIYVSCVIYKLEHSYNFLICSKLFAIVKSIISLILHEFVVLVNMFLRSWFHGQWEQTCALLSMISNYGVAYLMYKVQLMAPIFWFLNLLCLS